MQKLRTLKRVGEYTVFDKCIYQGILSKVYLCKADKQYVCKIFDRKQIEGNYYFKQALYAQFMLLRRNKKCQNIIQIIDFLKSKNNFYLIFELCQGGTLQNRITDNRMPEDQAVSILTQIVRGYLNLYKNGIIHRDIKPQNIFIKGSCYKLGDFGFSKSVFSNKALYSEVGTYQYMSPQILKGVKYTSKADVWSLGITLYMMLHNFFPWQFKTKISLLERIENEKLIIHRKDLSEICQNFISQCLVVQEQSRQSWKQVFQSDLFKGQFQYEVSKINKKQQKLLTIVSKLRQNIRSMQLSNDQEQILKEKQINEHKFKQLVLAIEKELEEEQVSFLFNQISTNKITIQIEHLFQWFYNHNIILTHKTLQNLVDILSKPQINKKLIQELKTLIQNNERTNLQGFIKFVQNLIKKPVSEQEFKSLAIRFTIGRQRAPQQILYIFQTLLCKRLLNQ